MDKPLKFQWDTIIAVDDMDLMDRLKPSSILQFFQDIATEHANILNIGFKKMLSMKCFWVLTKVCAEIIKHPKMCDKVKVITYPRKASAVEATRDYYIFNDKGEVLVKGSSKWCVLDYEAKKIRRISDVFNLTDDHFRAEDVIEGGCVRLSIPADMKHVGDYQVKITDLDANMHMNNAKYANFLLDFEDINFVKTHDIRRFEINYVGELPFAERVKIMKSPDREVSDRVFRGVRSDGKDSFIMEAKWEKKTN